LKEDNRVIFISGASRGLGRALAIGFARDGKCALSLVARTESKLLELQKELTEEFGIKSLVQAVDLSNPLSAARAVDKTLEEFGHIDVVVNNAGLGQKGTLDIDLESFEQMLSVNLTAPFAILQKAVPHMLSRKQGTIFNVSSRSGKVGFAGFGAYSASKFGLLGLGESLHRELSPQGIRVTTLCPSWIDTEMATKSGCKLSSDEMLQSIDLMKTINWVMSLSPAACVREVMIECRGNLS